jgi:hypothetical protein
MPDSEVTIFAGRFGSGKTEAAINFALSLVRGAGLKTQCPSCPDPAIESWAGRTRGVTLIDLDIVTPYFRSRETAEAMREQGVEVIAPSAIGQHLDTPAITPQILGAIEQLARPTVLDVGGDRQGARALGQFSEAIRQRGYTMHFVVNPFRPFTDTVEGLARSITEIEQSARLEVSSLVSNPNLMHETSADVIVRGHATIEAFARELGLSIAFVCLERCWAKGFESDGATGRPSAVRGPERHAFAQPILVLDRFFVMSWEELQPDQPGQEGRS